MHADDLLHQVAEASKHAAAAAAAAASEDATRARLRAVHEETRRWWMEMAPVYSVLERQRQWRLQRLVVLPFFEAATAEVLHGSSSSSRIISSSGQAQWMPPSTAPRVMRAPRTVASEATLSAAVLEARRQCAGTAPWRLAARASSLASLALGTAPADDGGEWMAMCRVRMRLCARWASDVFESPFASAPSVHATIRTRRLRASSELWADRAGKFARATRREVEVRSRFSAFGWSC